MKTCCNINQSGRFATVSAVLLMAVIMGIWYPARALASCDVTSNGSGSVGRITKFTPSSCNIENSAIFESSGKVGIGTTTPAATLDVNGGGVIRGATGIGAPASGGFEFQVSAPNQIGLLIEGPASGVGAGLDFKTTGTGGLQWEILDTGATAAQGPDKLNIRDINTGQDVFTIRGVDGAIGINTTNPGAFQLDVVTADGNGGVKVSAAASTAILATNSNGDAMLAENNSLASTLGVQNSTTDTTAVIAEFVDPSTPPLISGSENGCVIDTQGNLSCTGTISSNSPVASADPAKPGANRLAKGPQPNSQNSSLRLTEAGDQWREDFGSARLVHGVAEVALDPDFVRMLSTAGYQVFFTPKGDCKGLYIAGETSTSFQVREVGGGRSSLGFDYRVVGQGKPSKLIRVAGGAFAKAAVSNRPAS